MNVQHLTKVLALPVLLTLITGCESAYENSHDCKAIAKAISQNDKSSLRSEYDKLMYESILAKMSLKYGPSLSSYAAVHSYCVMIDQGRIRI
jgi:hypothetical protein